jgi:hypothetical protein
MIAIGHHKPGTSERCEGKGADCKTSGGELRLIMFSIYWMIGVWGSSPPGDCAILEARWLHFLRFLKKIRKIIALNISENSLSRQANPLNWKCTFAPLAPPGKGQHGRLPLLPPPPPSSSGVPNSLIRQICVGIYIFHRGNFIWKVKDFEKNFQCNSTF